MQTPGYDTSQSSSYTLGSQASQSIQEEDVSDTDESFSRKKLLARTKWLLPRNFCWALFRVLFWARGEGC